MPSSSLNTLMEKRKPRKSDILVLDELALAKSAAWAWYGRGSGSDGRPTREVDVWRTKREPRQSRYKLEALRSIAEKEYRHTKNSLLDNYEIERISRELDHYIESSGGGGAVAAEIKNVVDVQKKIKIPKGFWLRHVPGCGSSRNDVVENRSGRPEKGRVAAVEVVGGRRGAGPSGIRA